MLDAAFGDRQGTCNEAVLVGMEETVELLRQALSHTHAQLDVDAPDVPSLCRVITEQAVALGLIAPACRAELADELLCRERAAPTAIGQGVAVPHVYANGLERSAILFFRLREPLHMGALDGTATRYVFFLLGASRDAISHLSALATIARVMTDELLRYSFEQAQTSDDLLAAFDRFMEEQRTGQPPTPPHADALSRTGQLFGGVKADVQRRLATYRSDFVDGLHAKTLSAVGFLFFACLAPAVTFGGVMSQKTDGAIGASEMLVGTAIGGVLFSLLAGQPLIVVGGTGPLLVLTALLYQQCSVWDLPFLPVYTWTGLWAALLLVLLAALDASALMRWFTRFTNEIFAALISLIFIGESLFALYAAFADRALPADAALLTLVLAVSTLYIGYTLAQVRNSSYFSSRIREFLSDFGPTIALLLMTVVALRLDDIQLSVLDAPDRLGTTSGRPWLVPFWTLPVHVRLLAIIPALLMATLIFLNQGITGRIINAPDRQLRKGGGYHLDLLVVGCLVALGSLFGVPWMCSATVRSINQVHSLTTERRDRPVFVRETRLAGLAVHALIGLALLALPLLKLVPLAVLYGLFLIMGFNSLHGNQFIDRIKLWATDPTHYPPHHYIGRVPMGSIRRFTLLQTACLAILWVIKVSPLGLLFPIVIASLVPFRLWLGRWFTKDELDELDAESVVAADHPRAKESGLQILATPRAP